MWLYPIGWTGGLVSDTKILSYEICNTNPDCHGLQEEEHQIGLKYNLSPLEKIEKGVQQDELVVTIQKFSCRIVYSDKSISRIIWILQVYVFITMTCYNAYDLGIVRALWAIWLMFIPKIRCIQSLELAQ